jgi:hypothetical protein
MPGTAREMGRGAHYVPQREEAAARFNASQSEESRHRGVPPSIRTDRRTYFTRCAFDFGEEMR